MNKPDTYAPTAMLRPCAHSDTIYRDTPFATTITTPATWRHFPRLSAEALPGEKTSDGILLGLAALLLPTVAYSFAQMWSLVSGGALEHAVRAFFP